MKSYLTILENKGSTAILKILYSKKEMMLTQLGNELKNYGIGGSALYSTLKVLLEAGIVKEDRKYRVRLLSLTEKGKKLIEGLMELDKKLLEDP